MGYAARLRAVPLVAVSSSSAMGSASRRAMSGGTAFPIWRAIAVIG